MYKSIYSFVFICLLAACGNPNKPNLGPAEQQIKTPAETPEARLRYAKLGYALLDSKGNEAPPIEPQTKTWPFGVMIRFTDQAGKIKVCSASHITLGKVVVNSHCLGAGYGPEAYYVTFYNTRGKKDAAQVEKILFAGDIKTQEVDVAILKIKTEDAIRWHVVDGEIRKFSQNDIEAEPPSTFELTIWAFDPDASWEKEFQAAGRNGGSIFKPRTCIGSRTSPRMSIVHKDNKVTNIDMDELGKRNIVMDQCDRKIEKGNSGSLVTMKNNFKELLGAAFDYATPPGTDDATGKFIRYWGNNRKNNGVMEIPYQPGYNTFARAVAFDYLLSLEPGLF